MKMKKTSERGECKFSHGWKLIKKVVFKYKMGCFCNCIKKLQKSQKVTKFKKSRI